MARTVSDEELQLRKRARRRLVGAIALVTAMAVVLPMILDSEPRQTTQNINIQIPSPESGAFAPKAASLVPQSGSDIKAPETSQKPDAVAGTGAKPAVPAVPEPKAETAAVKEAVQPVQKPEAGAGPAKQPAPKEIDNKAGAKSAKAPAEQFVVQVAALSDAAKAKRMQQEISAAGVKSYTEVVKTAKGDVTRVRAGPFATRGAAEKVQKQLKTLGYDGKVVPKSP